MHIDRILNQCKVNHERECSLVVYINWYNCGIMVRLLSLGCDPVLSGS